MSSFGKLTHKPVEHDGLMYIWLVTIGAISALGFILAFLFTTK